MTVCISHATAVRAVFETESIILVLRLTVFSSGPNFGFENRVRNRSHSYTRLPLPILFLPLLVEAKLRFISLFSALPC